MASTYSNLKIQLMATGENSGTWGNVTNANLGDAIEQAIVETATVTFASANVTLTLSDSNSRQDARALRLNLTGTTGGARDLIVPAIQKPYLVNNGTADIITVKVSGQTGIAVPASTSMLLYNNGTDVVVAFNRVVGNLVGTASNATVLQTARTIAISGNATGTATSFDGSGNISIPVTAINADGITSGTLGVARGGTGASTLTAENVIIGNGTSAVKFVAAGTSGNVLTSNGSAWVSQAIAAGGNYVMQVYTSPATWTKPATVKAVKVTVVGAGGNGGGRPGPTVGNGGNGGGGGAAIDYVPQASIPGPVSVTVGTAPSKTSSFGGFVSTTGGGDGGNGFIDPGTGDPAAGATGAGGAGSGGLVNFTAQAGYPPGTLITASSALEFGSIKFGTATPGQLYGGGATGRVVSSTGSGGTGAAGIVIVEEFY